MASDMAARMAARSKATKLANPEFLKPQRSGKAGAPLIVLLCAVGLMLAVFGLYWYAWQRPLPDLVATYPEAPDFVWDAELQAAKSENRQPRPRSQLPRREPLHTSGRRLLSPIRTTEAVLNWSSQRALDAFSFNFVDFADQQAQMRPYFTEGGWEAFQEAMVRAEVQEVVENRQLVISAIVTGDPVLVSYTPLLDGTRMWNVQVKLTVTSSGGSAATIKSQALVVQLTVISLPASESVVGLAIKNFVAVPDRGGSSR